MDAQGVDRTLMFPTAKGLLEERMQDDQVDACRDPLAQRVAARAVVVQLRTNLHHPDHHTAIVDQAISKVGRRA
jgi:hypothetical protein